jgi:hypothetical protein
VHILSGHSGLSVMITNSSPPPFEMNVGCVEAEIGSLVYFLHLSMSRRQNCIMGHSVVFEWIPGNFHTAKRASPEYLASLLGGEPLWPEIDSSCW